MRVSLKICSTSSGAASGSTWIARISARRQVQSHPGAPRPASRWFCSCWSFARTSASSARKSAKSTLRSISTVRSAQQSAGSAKNRAGVRCRMQAGRAGACRRTDAPAVGLRTASGQRRRADGAATACTCALCGRPRTRGVACPSSDPGNRLPRPQLRRSLRQGSGSLRSGVFSAMQTSWHLLGNQEKTGCLNASQQRGWLFQRIFYGRSSSETVTLLNPRSRSPLRIAGSAAAAVPR